jgi:spectinomycin phosphotransferase
MWEKPNLPDELLVSSVRGNYGAPVSGIEFLPLGADASASVYQVRTEDGRRLLLKVRQGAICDAGLVVPRYLRDRGIEEVIAPLPTRAQELRQRLHEYSLILYPFLEADVAIDVGLSEFQWTRFGAAMKRVHSVDLPLQLRAQVREERFSPSWRELAGEIQRALQDGVSDDASKRELAAFWRERREEIEELFNRYQELGRSLQNRPLEFVLCHADVHPWNILVAGEERLFIVDWDSLLLAPKECDLMFVANGGFCGPRVEAAAEAAFFRGYGNTEIDPLALAYYRHDRVVQDILEYGDQALLRADVGEITRKNAVQGLKILFEPGKDAERALRETELTAPRVDLRGRVNQ